MEAFIAKLAVYNLVDARRLFRPVLLLLKYVSRDVSDNVLYISFAFIVVVIIVYITKLGPSSHQSSNDIFSRFEALSNSKDADCTQIYKWFVTHKLSISFLCNLWISSLNDLFGASKDDIYLKLEKLSDSILSGIEICDAKVSRNSSATKLIATTTVRISNVCLNSEFIYRNTGHSKRTVLSMSNFYGQIRIYFEHHGPNLSRIMVDFVIKPDFDVETSISDLTASTIKYRLSNAVMESKVIWEIPEGPRRSQLKISQPPDYSGKDVLNVRNRFTFETSNIHEPAETEKQKGTCDASTADAIQVAEGQITSDLFAGDSLSSVDSKSSHSKVPQQSCSSSEALFRSSDAVVVPVQEDTTCTSVVLSHNASLRKTMNARHIPRKTVGKMVRSASCYAEEGEMLPSQLHDIESSPDTEINDQIPTKISFEASPSSLFNSPTLDRMTEQDTPGNQVIDNTHAKLPDFATSLDSTVISRDGPIPASRRRSHNKADLSPLQERLAHNLASRKLLIKVVKAEDLSLKNTSYAYCVVELDEPYQRHSTHCSSAGQVFWDQHLLFDLNSNSKRVALEVFELAKRKKSVSKGRAEILLSSLLVSTASDIDNDISTPGVWDTSEMRRQLPLIDRTSANESGNLPSVVASTVMQSVGGASNAATMMSQVALGALGPGQLLNNPKPSIIAEFNFMEKASEDIRQRTITNSSPLQRASSSRHTPHSPSMPSNIQNSASSSPIDTSSSVPHSTSLEFSSPKFGSPRQPKTSADISSVSDLSSDVHTNTSDDRPESSEDVASPELQKCNGGPRHPSRENAHGIRTGSIVRTGSLLSPVPLRRALLERANPGMVPSPLSLRSNDFKISDTNSEATSSGITSPCPSIPSDVFFSSVEKNRDSSVTLQNMAEEVETTELSASLDKSDSKSNEVLHKRTDVIRTEEFKNLPESPSFMVSQSSVGATRDDSILSIGSPSFSQRGSSLANRLKPTRLRSTGVLRPNKRDDTSNSGISSLALLGPSRQLAGVVASLSSLAADSATSPIAAAAIASAAAVAGATGTWRSQTLSSADPTDAANISDPCSRRNSKYGQTEEHESEVHLSPSSSISHDPPECWVPPAACVAAESPGTFTALAQPRRSDASNLSLFRLFRHKKKRFRSVGAEKLLYWDSGNLDELDAISTEGYHRILQDEDPTDHQGP